MARMTLLIAVVLVGWIAAAAGARAGVRVGAGRGGSAEWTERGVRAESADSTSRAARGTEAETWSNGKGQSAHAL